MSTATMKDPKVVLNEAIDVAFAREPVAPSPLLQRLGWTSIIAAGATLAAVATTTTVFVIRRRAPAKSGIIRGSFARRFGFGHYRLGHVGTAYIAYSYKLPQVRFVLPRPSYKLPVKSR